MSDKLTPPNPSEPLDDELAQFTDKLLGGQPEDLADDEELRQLQATVARMQRTFGQHPPDPVMSQRIKVNLVRQWRATQRPDNGRKNLPLAAGGSWWQNLLGRLGLASASRGRQLRLVYAAGLAIAILLPITVFLLLNNGFSNTPLPGAVVESPGYPAPGSFQPINILIGRNERASVAGPGPTGEGNQDSWASAVSADGRYVAFVSAADNLVTGDANLARDVFVFDRLTGQIERISLDSAGQEGNGDSLNPALSADGRYVAFESVASNLVANDGNNTADVFLHDRQTAATIRVSVNAAGQEGQGASHGPALSGDGRYLAYWSDATNLVNGDGNSLADVFLYDRQTGTIERVSVDPAGQDADGASRNPTLAAAGRYVAFESQATDLVAGDGSSTTDIFLRDRQAASTTRVSLAPNDNGGNNHSYQPTLSADANFIAFHSHASNLVEDDDNNAADVFLYHLPTSQIERVSLNSDEAEGNAASTFAAVSGDGRYVAFSSSASNLAGGDVFGYFDVFIRDRWAGTTERASIDAAGHEPNGVSVSPALSADGRFVAFDSSANNLVATDTNGRIDVFLRDRIPPITLAMNYNLGMPGSFFTITGTNFLRNEIITIAANGHQLGTVPADADGNFTLVLTTTDATPGLYAITAAVQDIRATNLLTLDPLAEQRPEQNGSTILTLPSGIAFTEVNYLPWIVNR